MSAIQELLHCLGRQYLLPKLRILSISERHRPNHYSLFNPSLKWLLFNPPTREEAPSLLSHLARTAPHLEHITVSQTPLESNSFLVLERFPSLKSLETEDEIHISPESFAFTFPFAERLVSWKVDGLRVSGLIQAQVDAGWSNPELSSLEYLEICCIDTPSAILSILTNLALPSLRTFSFCAGPYWFDKREECLAMFSSLFGKKRSLRHLTVNVSYSMMKQRSTLDVGYLLQSAVPQDLETLDVRIPMLQSFCKPSLLAVVRVFPHLKKLTVVTSYDEPFSFRDLAALAHHMPKLMHLDIGISGKVQPKVVASTVPLCSHRLENLSISNMNTHDPVMLARFIDRIFPFATVSLSENPLTLDLLDVGRISRALKMMRECRHDDLERSATTQSTN